MPFGRAVRSHRDAADSPSGTSLIASNKRRARESVWAPEERLLEGGLCITVVSLYGLRSLLWNSPPDVHLLHRPRRRRRALANRYAQEVVVSPSPHQFLRSVAASEVQKTVDDLVATLYHTM